ncbi:hypothetical protein [Nonomuraea antimicrobica]|uniref:hypothetical protein n=1 Tax=Nonomuraea antimicrobica TaxID=561173 RepID=UPI0031ED8123
MIENRRTDGGLAKTKRSGDVNDINAADSGLRLGPVSQLVVTGHEDLAALLSAGEQGFFEKAEALLGTVPEGFPSMWPDVAALDDADRRWFLRAVHLLTLNDEAAPEDFGRQGALARLARWARVRGSDPDADDGSFEREVLTVSGWAGAVLGARLAAPVQEEQARLRAVYNSPADAALDEKADGKADRLRDALAQTLAERAARWAPPGAGGLESDDLQRLTAMAAQVEAVVVDTFSPYVRARFDGPLNEEFHYADHVHSSVERPDDLDAQVSYLYDEARAQEWPGDPDELRQGLREWLEDDPEAAAEVARLIKLTPLHGLPDTAEGAGRYRRRVRFDEVYLPTDVPAGPPGEWRWELVRVVIHELLHRLAHPAFVDAARGVTRPLVLTEGFTELLTAEALAGAYGLAAAHPAVRQALVGEAGEPPARARPSGPAAEILEIVGPDKFRAAYFLGDIRLIGLG